jgi:hypothetical protein
MKNLQEFKSKWVYKLADIIEESVRNNVQI